MADTRLYKHITRLMRESAAFSGRRLSRIGMHPGQPALLALVARGTRLSQKEIAEELMLAPSTVNIMLGRMERAGWVARSRCEGNGRCTTVSITPAGTELFERMLALEATITDEIFVGFTDEERERFVDLVDRLAMNMKAARESDFAAEAKESEGTDV